MRACFYGSNPFEKMARSLVDASNRKRKQTSVPPPSTSKPRLSSNISITYKEVGALTFASRLIPERTPKRWDLISTFVSDSMVCDNGDSPDIDLCRSEQTGSTKSRKFNKSAIDCKQVASILSQSFPGTLRHSDEVFESILSTYPERTALKHIVLVPPIKDCCGEPIIIRSRPSFPLVYTSQGTYVAAVFHGECRKGCSTKFHYSYYKRGDTIHYHIPQGEKYFQLSSQTIFEIALLDDFTHNISISGASFESRAEVYNENFRDSDYSRLKHLSDYGRSMSDAEHPWKLTEQRVEDGWFLYMLVCYYRDINQLDDVNFATSSQPSQRKDLDLLCGRAWEVISQSASPWINHKCHKLGCSEGL